MITSSNEFGRKRSKRTSYSFDSMTTEKLFSPRGALKHPHLQSVLASFKLRRWWMLRRFPALKSSERIILETSEGRLAADINLHPQPVGHAVLIHGWEGCSNSVYLVALGTYLYNRGYSISRLNLRDHGNTYHLNEGPFHGLLLQEVAEATQQLCERYSQGLPTVLAGFSMGGNFALRVASVAKEMAIPLTAVFAISPAVRPLETMRALATGPKLYHHYFRKKWRRSIRAKQAAWAQLYNFEAALKLNTLDEMTDYFVHADLLPAATAEAYLEGYRVDDNVVNNIAVPTYLLTSADDPVIPVKDIRNLPKSAFLHTTILLHGGHCGFVDDYKGGYVNHWIYNRIQKELAEVSA